MPGWIRLRGASARRSRRSTETRGFVVADPPAGGVLGSSGDDFVLVQRPAAFPAHGSEILPR
jgi:hypothetical protein